MHLFHALLACAIAVTVSATPVPDDGGPNYLPHRTLFPNYIVPINQSNPTSAGGTKYEAEIKYTGRSDQIRSIIGWDIPTGGPKNCIIKLELSQEPGQPQNTWKATGGGRMNAYILSDSPPIDYRTISWDNKPLRHPLAAQWSVAQPISGGKAVITGASIPCPEGRLFIELTSDEQSLLYLKWFELTTPRNGITLEMSNS